MPLSSKCNTPAGLGGDIAEQQREEGRGGATRRHRVAQYVIVGNGVLDSFKCCRVSPPEGFVNVTSPCRSMCGGRECKHMGDPHCSSVYAHAC